MLKTKQIAVIALALAVVGMLLARPIKGLVTGERTSASADTRPGAALSLESVSNFSKQNIHPDLVREISGLEERLGKTEGEERLPVLEALAAKWDDVSKFAPQGFIYMEMANIAPKFEFWLKSGDAFRTAYGNLRDTAMVAELNRLAIRSYGEAIALDANSLEAKTGLGAAMVTGSGNPMAGIALLREVVQKDPKNIQANKTLGLFSLQSRQFDKAVERFATVVEQQPDAESYFYLATGYENIGLKNEAIAAFQKSKELASDPTLSQFIDRRVAELSK